MRWLLPALLILLGAAPDDKEAAALYAKLRKSLETAQTISVEFKGRVESGDTVEVEMSGMMFLKGEDRWRLSIQTSEGPRGEAESMSTLSDGKQVTATGRRVPKGGDVRETAGRYRKYFPDSVLFMVEASAREGLRTEPPAPEKIRDGGTETLDGVPARILEYPLAFQNQELSVKVWLDPEGTRVFKRVLTLAGERARITETMTRFEVNVPIPDSAFVYASLQRLAQARATQLARSCALYANFIGRTPASLDELLKRPADLPETGIWPAGGYLLGESVPLDPWKRPWVLRPDGGRVFVESLGADGKKGGTGDDQDVSAEFPASLRMPVCGATPRLKTHYETRVQIHLVAAAVKGYRDTNGALPRKKASLFEKPEGDGAWPEGGWIPGGAMPRDAWGEELRLVTDVGTARISVQDLKARLLTFKQLLPEERRALEDFAKPRLSAAELQGVAALVNALRDDDLDTRQSAQAKLFALGPAVDAALADRLATEKDAEARARIEEIRRGFPRPAPLWKSELQPLSLGISGDGSSHGMMANERSASTSLKTLASAEADFRANDRDWNKVNDFWTADVSGLYRLKDAQGQMMKLIELSVALADGAPAPAGAAAGRLTPLTELGVPQPKAGYLFRAMEKDNSETPPALLQDDTGGDPAMGKVHNTSKFGYCAYPAEYGASGVRTFILNENNTVFWKDTEGEPVIEWPTDEELRNWSKLD